MTAEDTRCLWKFTTELFNESIVICPDCKVPSPLSEWNEGEVYCEDCGSHAAMVCPRCEDRFDHVYQEKPFEVVQHESTVS